LTPGLRLATAAAIAAAVAGCGLGPGPASKGTATLVVTRDYGSERLASASENDPRSSETVLRFLDRSAHITTRYGGGFVQSIDGLAGAESGGRRFDWFFYVNGLESPVGSTQVPVKGGDRIWWDYRDWTSAMSVPAVVGSWPQPFVAAAREGQGVVVDCAGSQAPCRIVRARLAAAGVKATIRDGIRAAKGPRIVVGPWSAVRIDSVVGEQLDQPPSVSGVFAEFDDNGRLQLMRSDGRIGQRAEPGTGLVAALRPGEGPPTWVVTSRRRAGVVRSAARLDATDLTNHYAIATFRHAVVPLPLAPGGAK
jgi:hypothetical protein